MNQNESDCIAARTPREDQSARAGTYSGNKKEEYINTEEAAKRIIGHFNTSCSGRVGVMDQGAISKIASCLRAYSESDCIAVIDWGNKRWPPGNEWRQRCLNIGHMFGEKFGTYLTAASQAEEEKPKGPWRPPEDQIL